METSNAASQEGALVEGVQVEEWTCYYCGNQTATSVYVAGVGESFFCDRCGKPLPSAVAPSTVLQKPRQLDELVRGRPRTLVRTYKGTNQSSATAVFQTESGLLAERGYAPTNLSWAPGQWDAGAFLVAVLLFIVLIGIFVFLYMLIVKPEGTLTVTYTKSEVATDPAEPSTRTAPAEAVMPTLTNRLTELEEAHEAGLMTDEEFERRRTSLIELV